MATLVCWLMFQVRVGLRLNRISEFPSLHQLALSGPSPFTTLISSASSALPSTVRNTLLLPARFLSRSELGGLYFQCQL